MSLINDALKRAKAAQQSAVTTPLQFRSADPNQKPRRSPWPRIIGVGVALVIVLGFVKIFSSRQQPLQVEAKAVATDHGLTNETTSAPLAGSAVLPPAPKPTTLQPRTQEVAAAASPTAGEPPKPLVPRLQAVFYHPVRPSAMISGKSVFVGSKVGEFRVVAITRDSATLVSETQTNILTFEQ
jgi:hypothetical protein